MGDDFWLDAKDKLYEPCGDAATHRIRVNSSWTYACRRHALEAREVADEIRPRLAPGDTKEGRR